MYNSVQTAGKPKKSIYDNILCASELITWDFSLKFFIIYFGEKIYIIEKVYKHSIFIEYDYFIKTLLVDLIFMR